MEDLILIRRNLRFLMWETNKNHILVSFGLGQSWRREGESQEEEEKEEEGRGEQDQGMFVLELSVF